MLGCLGLLGRGAGWHSAPLHRLADNLLHDTDVVAVQPMAPNLVISSRSCNGHRYRASDDTFTMVSYTGSHGSYMGLERVARHTEQLGDGLVYDGHRQYGLHAPAALRTPHRTRNADINPTLRMLTSSRPYVRTWASNAEHRDTHEECVGSHARIGTRRTV